MNKTTTTTKTSGNQLGGLKRTKPLNQTRPLRKAWLWHLVTVWPCLGSEHLWASAAWSEKCLLIPRCINCCEESMRQASSFTCHTEGPQSMLVPLPFFAVWNWFVRANGTPSALQIIPPIPDTLPLIVLQDVPSSFLSRSCCPCLSPHLGTKCPCASLSTHPHFSRTPSPGTLYPSFRFLPDSSPLLCPSLHTCVHWATDIESSLSSPRSHAQGTLVVLVWRIPEGNVRYPARALWTRPRSVRGSWVDPKPQVQESWGLSSLSLFLCL